jgi:hypothetical protein
MQALSDIMPLAAWDGGRRLAVSAADAPARAILTLIAHGPESSACIAVWEAAAGLCVALLPEGTLHIDATLAIPGGVSASAAIELDAQLAPSMTDLKDQSLRYAVLDPAAPALGASATRPGTGLASLNLPARLAGGLRLKVGPLVRIDADDMVTAVEAVADGTLRLTLKRPGAPTPALAAFLPADASGLAAAAADATGAAGPEAAQRGFQVLAPDAAGALSVAPFGTGDALAVFSPRNHRLSSAGHDLPGTRLVLTLGADGSIESALTSHAYKPATSTALAALSGGGNALAIAGEGGAQLDRIDQAAALAEAFWKRARQGEGAPSPHLASLTIAPAASHPMARLTASAAEHADAAISPLTAAVGAALALPPALIEDIEALPAGERAALAQWAAADAGIAAAACRARVALPPRGDPTADARVARAVAAAANPAFAETAADVAQKLAGSDPATAATLGRIADNFGGSWLTVDEITATQAILDRHPVAKAAAAPVARLLTALKRDARAWAEAQTAAREADLGQVAERRSMIPVAASGAGLPPETADQLEAELPKLSTAEILLLHGHLARASQRQALIRGVKFAVLAMDEAAGSGDLASRMDRSGDPLVGMTRIGSAAEPMIRELVKVPQARDALLALNGWINACVPAAETGHALSEQLVRNVKSYGCFLLMNAIANDCRKLLDPATEGAAAYASRLTSGLAETLPRFAAAAAAMAGDDLRLGVGFTDRLPSLHGKAAT